MTESIKGWEIVSRHGDRLLARQRVRGGWLFIYPFGLDGAAMAFVPDPDIAERGECDWVGAQPCHRPREFLGGKSLCEEHARQSCRRYDCGRKAEPDESMCARHIEEEAETKAMRESEAKICSADYGGFRCRLPKHGDSDYCTLHVIGPEQLGA